MVIKWGNPSSSTKCFRTIDLPSLLLSHGLVQWLLPSLSPSEGRLRFLSRCCRPLLLHHLIIFSSAVCVRVCKPLCQALACWLAGWLAGCFGKYLVTINEERVYLGCIPPPTVLKRELKKQKKQLRPQTHHDAFAKRCTVSLNKKCTCNWGWKLKVPKKKRGRQIRKERVNWHIILY